MHTSERYQMKIIPASLKGKMIGKTINFGIRRSIHLKGNIFPISDISKYNYEAHYDLNAWSPPDDYLFEVIPLESTIGYKLSKKDSKHTHVIYQIHGGGYMISYGKMYSKAALRYSKVNNDSDVFSLDYRTAPKYLFPNALSDAIEGYLWLLSNGYLPENIIITGDSSGGGLTLALTLFLRDKQIQLPKMLILASPWADLSEEGESYKTFIENERLFGGKSKHQIPTFPVDNVYAKGMDLHHAYISPVYGDYKNFPPMLIQVGKDEILFSDSVTAAQKAKEANVIVTFNIYEHMYHCFYLFTPTIPESKRAWKEIREFIEKYK